MRPRLEQITELESDHIDVTAPNKNATKATESYKSLFETTEHLEAPQEASREHRLRMLLDADFSREPAAELVTIAVVTAALRQSPRRTSARARLCCHRNMAGGGMSEQIGCMMIA